MKAAIVIKSAGETRTVFTARELYRMARSEATRSAGKYVAHWVEFKAGANYASLRVEVVLPTSQRDCLNIAL